MALRLGAAPREKTSKLLPLLQEALRGGGSLTGEEACRLLLKLPRVRPDTARRLLETALDGDRRFLLMEDGSVSLAHAPEPSPVPLDQLAFTVVDLETTGGSAADRILEVGAVRVAQYRLADEFSTLINPGVPIPPFIASMTGIREAMLADAPPFRDVAEKLLEFLGDSVLVAHNLS